MAAMMVICLAIDHDNTPVGSLFAVPCDPGLKFALFKSTAMEKAPTALGADLSQLEVHCSPEIRLDMDVDALAAAISKLDFKKTWVHPVKAVKDVVSDPENMVLIIRKLGPQSLKRPRSPSDSIDQYDRLQQADFLAFAPSSAAQPSMYKATQTKPDRRLLDDRPQSDRNVAPITLLYDPFGRFDDIFCGREQLHTDSGINLAALEQNVDDFTTAMLEFYPNEDARRGAAIPLLAKIGFNLWPSTIGSTGYQTDGDSQVEGFIDTNLEIQNELPDANTIPYVQSTLYVGQSFKDGRYEKVAREMCKYWRIPALSITLVGHHIQFYATLLLGHRYRTVSLTPALSCCPSATNEGDRKHLYDAFAAALLLQKEIRRDLKASINASKQHPLMTVLDDNEYFFPAVSQILEYGCNSDDNKYIEFKILHYFGRRETRRHLYAAKVTKGPSKGHEILVKFSRSYCADLHSLCFERGRAPKLLGFQRLPGGWFAIAMEYLSDAIGIVQVPFSDHWSDGMLCDKAQLLAHFKTELTELVDGFHKEGFVHGDLRCANILSNKSGDEVWLIDFDWGGRDGEVHYPIWNLNKDLQTGRLSKTLDISKKDDTRILHAALRQLEDLWLN
ncbi:hypothetical protein D9619_006304 [Psilocybe cf. subviscida]|uniref:Protein kinase domain-containing protein n=1 Tax=Psilocybe cf. subviscida TaxID=2480587 RepID=A0A8H5B543_9AGAR|nr:hypothetical protein D9619_006304 [Psilocybe cf. subviscida]